MIEPVTALMVYVGSAILNGTFGNRADAVVHQQWQAFKENLKNHRPDTNHELQGAVYRAYLLATLQTCAALLEQKGFRVAAWFRLGVLPEKMADALRGLLRSQPAGGIAQGDQAWLEQVARDQLTKLKRLDDEPTNLPSAQAEPEFDALLGQLDLLMQPVEGQARSERLRQALTASIIKDLRTRFDSPPADFIKLMEARWFEFLCAAFQFAIKHNQPIANAFESRLLARLVARDEWQGALAVMSGESLRRIEEAQAWLGRQQQDGVAQVESLVSQLLPLLAFARDEASRGEMLAALIHAESQRVVDTVEASRDEILNEIRRQSPPPPSNQPMPLIHSLQIDKEVEGRINECRIILQAMGASAARVLEFAAPGGFGKTALLTRLVQALAPEGRILERVTLPDGATVAPRVEALLHFDCRGGLPMSVLFQKAGRLIGQERAFADLYNAPELSLADKMQRLFDQVTARGARRVWFVFDNFETLMAGDGSVMDEALREFFKCVVTGHHGARALIAARELPKFGYSERQQFHELREVGSALYQGLPPTECVSYLRKNDAHVGLRGSDAEVDRVLNDFAARVHWMPMALEWAVGYLEDVREGGETLATLLTQGERFFSEFDRRQMDDGLKRLHYEQLRLQPTDALGVLRLLAVFNRATPKGALAHLLDESKLTEVLASLARRKLVTHKETSDAYTLYVNDPLAVNLYSLHPIICENEFFREWDDPESLYETTAGACWGKAVAAHNVNRFAYKVALYECAEALYAHLVAEHKRTDLWNSYAAMLMNKGNALNNLTRPAEAIAEYDKAIAIRERLVNEEGQTHLANDLATAYGNKARVLEQQQEWDAAFAYYDNAIKIQSACVAQGMYWLMPSLLNSSIDYLQTRLRLRQWREAAAAVEAVIGHLGAFMEDERIHNELKQAAAKQREQMLGYLRAMDADGRESLYAELGERAEAVRQLVDANSE
ncbi:MAG: tetratricopeptide repeat protein [Blastocatellia bacterium]